MTTDKKDLPSDNKPSKNDPASQDSPCETTPCSASSNQTPKQEDIPAVTDKTGKASSSNTSATPDTTTSPKDSLSDDPAATDGNTSEEATNPDTNANQNTNSDYYSSLDLSSLPENADIPPPPRKPKTDALPPDKEAHELAKQEPATESAQEPLSEPAKDSDEEKEEGPITLLEHLGELRSRLVRSFIVIAIAFFACYSIADLLFEYLSLPLVRVMPEGTQLIFTAIPEGFFVYLKVAFVAAVFVASPYLFYQVWAFIAPGLYDEERRLIIPLSFCSAMLFIAGALFCYFLVFPFAFKFFMSYSTDTIVAMPTLNEYLGFSLKMLIAFGLIFEMPLFAFFLARMGLITPDWLRKQRRYAILVIFIVAAVLTPPDVFSQALMAIPMLFLYEISILVAATFHKQKKT